MRSEDGSMEECPHCGAIPEPHEVVTLDSIKVQLYEQIKEADLGELRFLLTESLYKLTRVSSEEV